jgi:hypothetical protein
MGRTISAGPVCRVGCTSPTVLFAYQPRARIEQASNERISHWDFRDCESVSNWITWREVDFSDGRREQLGVLAVEVPGGKFSSI